MAVQPLAAASEQFSVTTARFARYRPAAAEALATLLDESPDDPGLLRLAAASDSAPLMRRLLARSVAPDWPIPVVPLLAENCFDHTFAAWVEDGIRASQPDRLERWIGRYCADAPALALVGRLAEPLPHAVRRQLVEAVMAGNSDAAYLALIEHYRTHPGDAELHGCQPR